MIVLFFFFFKQKTAYEIGVRLVGSEMCIRDRAKEEDHGEDTEDNPRDGRPDGEVLGLLRSLLGAGPVPHCPLAVDLGGEDDRDDTEGQEAQHRRQDCPHEIVGRRWAHRSWGPVAAVRRWRRWRWRRAAVVRHASPFRCGRSRPDSAAAEERYRMLPADVCTFERRCEPRARGGGPLHRG